MDDRRRRPPSRGRSIPPLLTGRVRSKSSQQAPADDKEQAEGKPTATCTSASNAAALKKSQSDVKRAPHKSVDRSNRCKSAAPSSQRSTMSRAAAGSRSPSTVPPFLSVKNSTRDALIRNTSRQSRPRALPIRFQPDTVADSVGKKSSDKVATASGKGNAPVISCYNRRAGLPSTRQPIGSPSGRPAPDIRRRAAQRDVSLEGSESVPRTRRQENTNSADEKHIAMMTSATYNGNHTKPNKCNSRYDQRHGIELSRLPIRRMGDVPEKRAPGPLRKVTQRGVLQEDKTSRGAFNQNHTRTPQANTKSTKGRNTGNADIHSQQEELSATANRSSNAYSTKKKFPPRSALKEGHFMGNYEPPKENFETTRSPQRGMVQGTTPKIASKGHDILPVATRDKNDQDGLHLNNSHDDSTTDDSRKNLTQGSSDNFDCSPDASASSDILNQAASESFWVALLAKTDATSSTEDAAIDSFGFDVALSPEVSNKWECLEPIRERVQEDNPAQRRSLALLNESEPPVPRKGAPSAYFYNATNFLGNGEGTLRELSDAESPRVFGQGLNERSQEPFLTHSPGSCFTGGRSTHFSGSPGSTEVTHNHDTAASAACFLPEKEMRIRDAKDARISSDLHGLRPKTSPEGRMNREEANGGVAITGDFGRPEKVNAAQLGLQAVVAYQHSDSAESRHEDTLGSRGLSAQGPLKEAGVKKPTTRAE